MLNLKVIAPNATQITTHNTQALFSYDTCVACYTMGNFYRTETVHSKTTQKHINAWLDGRKAETKPQEFFDTLFD